MQSYRSQQGPDKIRALLGFSVLMLCTAGLLADENPEVSKPPEIVLDAPPAIKEDRSSQAVETEAATVYESKFFPGFRPCTSQDYHNHDYTPVACQDSEAARVLSTREEEGTARGFVEGDAVPQGNIYKLRFERIFKGKNR